MSFTDKKFICAADDIKENSFRMFSGPGGKECILLNINGKLKAFVNYCPHMGGRTEPEFKGAACVLRCQSHGATFDSETGRALSPPAPEGSGLRELNVVIEGDGIYYE